MSEESKSSVPPELMAALTEKLRSSNREEVQHQAVHLIAVLAEAAQKLTTVASNTAYGTSTLHGVLQAIDQQLGLLEAPSHTKQ